MSGDKKEEKVWMSMNGLVKQFGEKEKNKKTAKATKRAKGKVKGSSSKYIVKYDKDGVKHMILRG